MVVYEIKMYDLIHLYRLSIDNFSILVFVYRSILYGCLRCFSYACTGPIMYITVSTCVLDMFMSDYMRVGVFIVVQNFVNRLNKKNINCLFVVCSYQNNDYVINWHYSLY